jgi:uncharacterized membrane protein YgaE (UPF0421/DUF939 family)
MYIINSICFDYSSNDIHINTIYLQNSDIIVSIDDDMTFIIRTNYKLVDIKKIGLTKENTLKNCNKVLIENGYEKLKKDNIKISDNLTTYQSNNHVVIPNNKYIDEIKTLLQEFINKIFR